MGCCMTFFQGIKGQGHIYYSLIFLYCAKELRGENGQLYFRVVCHSEIDKGKS